jgi:hypothetical protein
VSRKQVKYDRSVCVCVLESRLSMIDLCVCVCVRKQVKYDRS